VGWESENLKWSATAAQRVLLIVLSALPSCTLSSIHSAKTSGLLHSSSGTPFASHHFWKVFHPDLYVDAVLRGVASLSRRTTLLIRSSVSGMEVPPSGCVPSSKAGLRAGPSRRRARMAAVPRLYADLGGLSFSGAGRTFPCRARVAGSSFRRVRMLARVMSMVRAA
jgi:hypothetical protein